MGKRRDKAKRAQLAPEAALAKPATAPGDHKWPWLMAVAWVFPLALVGLFVWAQTHKNETPKATPTPTVFTPVKAAPKPVFVNKFALYQPDLNGRSLTLPFAVTGGPLDLYLGVSDSHGRRLVTSHLGAQGAGAQSTHYDLGSTLIPGAYKVVLLNGSSAFHRRSARYTFLLEGIAQPQVVSTLPGRGLTLVFKTCPTSIRQLLPRLAALRLTANFFCTPADFAADPTLAADIIYAGDSVGLYVDQACPDKACLTARTKALVDLNRTLVRGSGAATLPMVTFQSSVPNADGLTSVGAAGYSYVIDATELSKTTSTDQLHPGMIVAIPWRNVNPLLKLIHTDQFLSRSLSKSLSLER
jgi:hypothetical protein